MSREVIKFVRVKAEDREQIAGLSAFAVRLAAHVSNG